MTVLFEPSRGGPVQLQEEYRVKIKQSEAVRNSSRLTKQITRSQYIPPEARPAFDFLLALSQKDYVAMPALFTEGALKKIQGKSWEQLSETWVYVIEMSGRSVDPSKYSISYRGSLQKGSVYFSSHGAKDLAIEVVKIEGKWLINER